MSGNAASRIARLPTWVRYSLIGGLIAFVATLAANLAITLLRPDDLCRAGPGSLLLLSLGAVIMAIGLVFTITFGIGLAAGAAALGGLVGAGLRPQTRSG